MTPDDPYSRVDYRRLVAWPERIEREWPFLSRVLGHSGRVIDLGSGTGEHSRFLASKGFAVVGIDSSPTTPGAVGPNVTIVEVKTSRSTPASPAAWKTFRIPSTFCVKKIFGSRAQLFA